MSEINPWVPTTPLHARVYVLADRVTVASGMDSPHRKQWNCTLTNGSDSWLTHTPTERRERNHTMI